MGYYVIFKNVTKAPETAEVYFTSEANSYGISYPIDGFSGTWFDGEVHPKILRRGMYYQINIRKVTAYEHLRSKCSDDSFYQWVSARLVKLSMMPRDSKNNQTCKMLSNEPCSSLPTLPSSVPFVDLPPCNSTAAATCYRLIVADILRNILFKGAAMTTKTCSIQEYELED